MYAASWSGGKDSCLACYEAIRAGYNVAYLVNMTSVLHGRVRFHGLPNALVQAQAEAMGLSLIQRATPDDDYEGVFGETLRDLLSEGLEGMVFGDIHIEAHRDWGRKMCTSVGIEAVHPLWGRSPEAVVRAFVEAGFEAVIVSGDPAYFSEAQMGLPITPHFIQWCGETPGIDVCGENGEYHTLVLDGPLFQRRLRLTESYPVRVNGHCFLDIRLWDLVAKDNMPCSLEA
ncbi:MAG: diphthine--ammonia ligase [Candidatus Zipacnadales bacterium]